MPRPRKPVEVLKFDGQFRKDRHGDRPELGGEEIDASQVPEILNDIGKAYWKEIVAYLNKVKCAQLVDHRLITSTARNYALWYRACEILEADPIDKEARLASAEFYRQWVQGVSRLGLSPVDRQKINITTKAEAKQVVSRVRS